MSDKPEAMKAIVDGWTSTMMRNTLKGVADARSYIKDHPECITKKPVIDWCRRYGQEILESSLLMEEMLNVLRDHNESLSKENSEAITKAIETQGRWNKLNNEKSKCLDDLAEANILLSVYRANHLMRERLALLEDEM